MLHGRASLLSALLLLGALGLAHARRMHLKGRLPRQNVTPPAVRPAPEPGNSLLGSTIPEGATRIIKMDLQMNEAVTSEVLGNDENYNDFLEDLRDESNKHGDVINITIPRPGQGGVAAPSGLGKVTVEFTEVTSAVKARNSMHGRKFAGRTITVDYVAESAYSAGMLD